MRYPWRLFWVLFAADIVGVAGKLPILLGVDRPLLAALPLPPVPLWDLALFQLAQNWVMGAVVLGLGLLLARRVGRGAPFLEAWLGGGAAGPPWRPTARTSALCGVGIGLVFLAAALVLSPRFPELPFRTEGRVLLWKRFLFCFYGGFFEEIMARLFVLTLLAWLLGTIWRGVDGLPSTGAFWASNTLVAVLSGLAYVPAVLIVTIHTDPIVAAAYLLNILAAAVFGYLYWRRGLEAAMLAHLTADVVQLVVGPAGLPN